MAGNSMFSALVSGVNDFNSVTKDIELKTAQATIAGIKANQNKIKTAIRANLRGAPRWTQRGKSKVYDSNFQAEGTTGQHNSPRSGGPGRMTGVLYKGVGGVRKPKEVNGTWFGGVGIGSSYGIMKTNNFKKGTLEAKFPYFKPAVEKVLPVIAETYAAGWDKAISRMGGIL